MSAECIPMRVDQLREGDLVDLESCPYLGKKDGFWQYEYAEVEEVEQETHDCVRVCWVGIDAVGYYPDQLLLVKRREETDGDR
jgi:hypothetical protein